MKAFIFDTETTGLIENRTVHLDKQPHIIEFFGQLVDLKSAKVMSKFHSLVKPPIALPLNVKGNKGIADLTGITEEMLVGQPAFREVADQIEKHITGAASVIAHNLSFDMDMVEVEFERLGRKIAWPKKRICTVEQTIHFRGHRLNLTKLYNLLFPGESFVAHRAESDVVALTRIACELYKRELL